MRFLFRLLFLALLLLCCLGGLAAWLLKAPLALPQTPFEFSVKAGSSVRSLALELRAAGLLPHEAALVWSARFTGRDRAIKAGSYELEHAVSVLELLDKLTQGDLSQSGITLVEGWNMNDLRGALRNAPGLRNTLLDLPETEMMRSVGGGESHAEGLFFPDTYFYAQGTNDAAVLKRAYRAMRDKLSAEWEGRAPGLPLASPYEALILASMVEKETGRAADRPLVASVFVNRLRQGMRLQTDPTVIYGLGERFDGDLKKRDLAADHAYNTYTRAGLPPTPIALPGLASLQAALHPARSNYLYFVARGDGSSQFSSTLAEHNRAVAKYQRSAK